MTTDCSLNYKKNKSSAHVVYTNCFECQNKKRKTIFCTQHVLNLYSRNSMNNMLSYNGLIDARMIDFDKDLPVQVILIETDARFHQLNQIVPSHCSVECTQIGHQLFSDSSVEHKIIDLIKNLCRGNKNIINLNI
jgi:hypothetical protein